MSNSPGELRRYEGAGNSFVLIDNRDAHLRDAERTAKENCDKFNVDGLLLVEKSKAASIKMRILNRDGSEADMCGNGSRCVAFWAHHAAGMPGTVTIETLAGVLTANVLKDRVRVRLTDPKDFRKDIALAVMGLPVKASFINTGVPHAVISVKNLQELDVASEGHRIRNDATFRPDGTNVCFMERLESRRIRIRTYERGVEGETLSCGTGATACALIAAESFGDASPITVETRSGENMNIYFKKRGTAFSEVDLEGSVKELQKQ